MAISDQQIQQHYQWLQSQGLSGQALANQAMRDAQQYGVSTAQLTSAIGYNPMNYGLGAIAPAAPVAPAASYAPGPAVTHGLTNVVQPAAPNPTPAPTQAPTPAPTQAPKVDDATIKSAFEATLQRYGTANERADVLNAAMRENNVSVADLQRALGMDYAGIQALVKNVPTQAPTPSPTPAPTPAPTGIQQLAATPAPVANQEISTFVQNTLGQTNLTDQQKAQQINQAANQYGVSRDQIAQATGYSLDQVNQYLGANNTLSPAVTGYLGTKDFVAAGSEGARPDKDTLFRDITNTLSRSGSGAENFETDDGGTRSLGFQDSGLSGLAAQARAAFGDEIGDRVEYYTSQARPNDTRENRAFNQQLATSLQNEFTQFKQTAATDLRSAIVNGENLDDVYGKDFASSSAFINDIGGLQYGNNWGDARSNGILHSNPSSQGGDYRFNAQFGSDYFKDIVLEVAKNNGIPEQQARAAAGQFMLDNVIDNQTYEGGLIFDYKDSRNNSGPFLADLTNYVLAANGRGELNQEQRSALDAVGNKLGDALFVDNASRSFWRKTGNFVTDAMKSPAGQIFLTAAAGPGGLASGATNAATSTLVNAGLSQGVASAVASGIVKGTVAELTGGDFKGGFISGAVLPSIGDVGGMVDKGLGQIVSDGALKDFASTALTSGAERGLGNLIAGESATAGLQSGLVTGIVQGTFEAIKNATDAADKAAQEMDALRTGEDIDNRSPDAFKETYPVQNELLKDPNYGEDLIDDPFYQGNLSDGTNILGALSENKGFEGLGQFVEGGGYGDVDNRSPEEFFGANPELRGPLLGLESGAGEDLVDDPFYGGNLSDGTNILGYLSDQPGFENLEGFVEGGGYGEVDNRSPEDFFEANPDLKVPLTPKDDVIGLDADTVTKIVGTVLAGTLLDGVLDGDSGSPASAPMPVIPAVQAPAPNPYAGGGTQQGGGYDSGYRTADGGQRDEVDFLFDDFVPEYYRGYAQGGEVGFAKGREITGAGDGMSDDIPANIEGEEPVMLAEGEYVIPAQAVSALGNGSTKAGIAALDGMVKKIYTAQTGKPKQMKPMNIGKVMPV